MNGKRSGFKNIVLFSVLLGYRIIDIVQESSTAQCYTGYS
jgi:hypothetical protein